MGDRIKLFELSLKNKLTLYISPLKEEVTVYVEFTMAGRKEEVGRSIAMIEEIELKPPVYNFILEPFTNIAFLR